jgi:HK97 family phage prohead protease
MSSRDDIIDIPERRSVPITDFDVKEKNGIAHVEGYASVFDKGYDILGGPDSGVGWTEYVNQNAFKRTLSEKPDVVVLENHTGGPLARTKSGTLGLATDSTGLIPNFDLDLRDPQAKSVFIKLDRKDYDEMSFAFRVKANTWSENDTVRSLDEVSLHKGDVSIVNFGANPFTSVGLRSALNVLAREEFTGEELAELRSMSDQVDRAMLALKTARADEKPYGDVAYADQKNGKYPIDTKAHVKAAWSYINMPKNQEGYSDSELAEVKDRITAAAKKFGIEISDEKNAQEVVDIVRRALNDDEGMQGPDNDDGAGDSIARAVHDLVADAAGCTGETVIPADDEPTRNFSLIEAQAAKVPTSKGNLTIADAMRMRRPEDSPEPLTVEQATALRAS